MDLNTRIVLSLLMCDPRSYVKDVYRRLETGKIVDRKKHARTPLEVEVSPQLVTRVPLSDDNAAQPTRLATYRSTRAK